jgi:hypothetical protein
MVWHGKLGRADKVWEQLWGEGGFANCYITSSSYNRNLVFLEVMELI